MIRKILHIGKNLSKTGCWRTSLSCPKYSQRWRSCDARKYFCNFFPLLSQEILFQALGLANFLFKYEHFFFLKTGNLIINSVPHSLLQNLYNLTKHGRMLVRPYLMTFNVIFPIHLNFKIRFNCVLKAIIHRKKQWIILWLLEKVFSFSK